MPATIPVEVVRGLEQLATNSMGDVPELVADARQGTGMVDPPLLAQALEAAGEARATAGDSTSAWWLACAAATLRTPPDVAQQDEAEITAARFARALAQSAKACGEIPAPYRWLVAGQAELQPSPAAIELARKNAVTHLERLDAELTARGPILRAQLELPGLDEARLVAVEHALATYDAQAMLARAALRRVVDHVVGRAGGDPAADQLGLVALAELDDVVVPALRRHLAEARALTAGFAAHALAAAAQAAPPASGATSASAHAIAHAPASAAPIPSAHAPMAASAPYPAPASMPAASVDELERAMRSAFELAWASPGPQTRAAFEQAARARYTPDVAHIADPAAREAALQHYVTHALAQLPQL
jgi:hypothetical protein